MLLPFVIGAVASAGVALFARRVGLDRDRAFYPTVVIVIALYYVLFAVMAGSTETVLVESVVAAMFAAAAIAGFRSSSWLVVAALSGHGVLDAVHGHVIENPGVPPWWPAWCFAYDVGAAVGLAWLLRRGLVPGQPRLGPCLPPCGAGSNTGQPTAAAAAGRMFWFTRNRLVGS